MKLRNLTSRGFTGTALALALGVVLGGSLVAIADQSVSGDVRACVKTTGAVRILRESENCLDGERLVTWTQRGQLKASTRWYKDDDGDGYGDWYRFIDSAIQPQGFVEIPNDCDDSVVGGGEPYNPQGDCAAGLGNGDGQGPDCPTPTGPDCDGDGVEAWEYGGTDCNDTDARIYPSNRETRGDGVDNDCDFATADTGYDRPYNPQRFVAVDSPAGQQ